MGLVGDTRNWQRLWYHQPFGRGNSKLNLIKVSYRKINLCLYLYMGIGCDKDPDQFEVTPNPIVKGKKSGRTPGTGEKASGP